jgi:hypothetical protein|tara:strand:- start:169 stop:465 length:297 start_codon:yes stop_codon:yes gene_type:complete
LLYTSLLILLGILTSFFGLLSYYSIKKIGQYESIILNFNNRTEYINQQLKLIDDKGHFEADDEVGFFFEEIKLLSSQLDELFEPLDEVVDENKKKEKK